MSASISSFVSTVNRRGIARTNRFLVLIPPVRAGNIFSNPIGNAIVTQVGAATRGNSSLGVALLCSKAELPAHSMMTTDKREFPKPMEMIPYTMNPRSTSLEFLCGRDMFEYYFFQNWQNDIVNRETNLANYYDDYAVSMIVTQLDEKDNAIASVEFERCYPVSVSPISMNWSDKSYATLNVEMNYKKYRPIATPYSLAETALSLINKTAGSIGSAISSIF